MQNMDAEESAFQPNFVTFGDRGEFAFDSVTESVTPANNRIVQAVLYFFDKDHGDMRGLTIVDETVGAESAEEANDAPPVVAVPEVSAELYFDILEWPSEELMRLSVPVEDSEPSVDA